MSYIEHLSSKIPETSEWDQLLSGSPMGHMFMMQEWHTVWWDQFGEGAENINLCLYNGTRLEGAAPLVMRNGKMSLIGSQDLFDYGDFPILKGCEGKFYSSLVDYFSNQDCSMLELASIVEGSPTLDYLPEIARNRGIAVNIDQEDVCPGVNLPGDWEGYLQLLSKKDRHELRRKLRRISSNWDDFKVVKFESPDDIYSGIDDFISLMRLSGEAKHEFLNESREQFFRTICYKMSQTGRTRLFFLELSSHRVASAMCFDYGLSRLLYNSGLDPKYRAYSVGVALTGLCIKDAIENGIDYFDFLRGDEPYKYDLGAKDTVLYRMVLEKK